jgi:hypothetical protein
MPRRPRRADKERREFVETATQERTSRTFEQATIANGEAAALSLGITQRVIGPLTELALATAKEHTRLAAELQVAALEALHESQATALRQLAQWPDVAADPLHLWHRGLAESFDSAQRALTFMAASTRLVAQAGERLQTATLDTGRRVRETLDSSSAARDTTRR